MRPSSRRIARASVCPLVGVLCAAAVTASLDASADPAFLHGLHKNLAVTLTVPDNGDQNPYAVVVAPVSAGKISKGGVLVDNFNNQGNLQGLGTTIVDYDPSTNQLSLFARIPRELAQCPGGVGLTTAMTMLTSGRVIVGSLPSQDGTTKTKGAGCLILLDANGKVAGTIAGPTINGPWGNMAVVDKGDSAILFVSNTGFDVGAPGQSIVNKATVLRIGLLIPDGGKPAVTSQTVIAGGLAEQADAGVFIIGPTGLALDPKGTLYVSDALNNRILAIPDAATRSDSAGTGNLVSKDGDLARLLAMVRASNGDLLVTNGLNGKVVEIDPATGKQVATRWLNADKAQEPPGSGNLFGIALTAEGDGLYYVQDDVNNLAVVH
jgi:hypothetical protein